MDMTREAMEKIEQLTQPIIKEVDGHNYAITAGGITEIKPVPDMPDPLALTSLDALVKLVRTEALNIAKYINPIYITVPDPTLVKCFGQPDPNLGETRLTYYHAKATDVPGWEKETTMSFEAAMIALRTRFEHTTDTDYALKLLSEITTGAKVTFNDNGIATTVVTQKGIALQGNESIRPIITLKPFRTFQEVEQPASEFLIRITDRGIKFIEADGGMWRLAARKIIKAWLENALAVEVENGSVVVAL